MLDIVAKMLPELAGRIAEPMRNIDKLTIVDGGSGDGATRLSTYVTNLMATAPDMLKSVSGIDLEALIRKLTGQNEVKGGQFEPEALEQVLAVAPVAVVESR